jgi:dTDP-4-amino-4,6-dideoxygalactose transaminase
MNQSKFDSTSSDELALFGGPACVRTPQPHEVWPPNGSTMELEDLSRQRNVDINVRGRIGPIAEFESEFLKFLENAAAFAVTFNSGTSALWAAYLSIGLADGDEVIGPALTYHAALSPLFVLGARPILVDIDRKTRCLDADKIEAAITDKTRAITVVHQWGHPANMDKILAVAARYKLRVIEDCSHAHGSRYKGKLCGLFGDVSVFSLQTAKMIFAGEGGILITSDPQIYYRATLAGHYRDRARDLITDDRLGKYWVTGLGMKLRMSVFNAIVARYSLKAYPQRKASRHACLNYFNEQLRKFEFLELHEPATDLDMGAWYGFKPLYLPDRLHGLPRELFVKALCAEGVEISIPSAPCLDSLPLYQECMNPVIRQAQPTPQLQSLTVARTVEAHALSLPTFAKWPSDREVIDEYVWAIAKIARSAKRILSNACSESH